MMSVRHIQSVRRISRSLIFAVMLLACSALSNASATFLLEEPYGKMGFFTATGHAAVYLSGVCAETPIVLRPCNPGETGVVISRYDGVDDYDWVAIPLIPYLYAVDRPEDVPLFADAKMAAFLRDHYRRQYLEAIAPDKGNGGAPGGNWYELVGSSYDRTIYGFDIATTPQQDAALIRKLNSSQNDSHFRLVWRNCADFAKDILNFYYPSHFHRSIVSDLGMTTPKQMAKLLIRYSAKHPELQFSRIVIPQVPGSMPRSSKVHGVVDSFFTSKKYIVPSAIVSPIFAGCVAAVYIGTGGERFEPTRDAMVFVVGGDREAPLGHEDLRAYRLELKHLLASSYSEESGHGVDKAWEKLQAKSQTAVDAEGRPVLEVRMGDELLRVGIAADNVLSSNASPQIVRQLLEARLQSELHRGPVHGLTETEVARDWKLLQSLANQDTTVARSAPRADSAHGNAP